MSRSRRRPSTLMTIFHLIFGLMTCGLWWVWLWLYRNGR